MNDTQSVRPIILFTGSYGTPAGTFSKPSTEQADGLAYELGRAFIEKDIDLAIGGQFRLAVPFTQGAAAACSARGLELRDRLTYFFAEKWPPPADACCGKLYQINDTDNFWLRVLQQTAGLLVYSGRDNARSAIECAELLGKDVFPIGVVNGASGDAWNRYSSPDLKFLGDRSLTPRELAEQLSDAVLRRLAERTHQQKGASAAQDSARDGDILILIHGIRTQAAWAEMVRSHIEAQTPIKVQPIRYGFFDTIRFLSPLLTRSGPVKRITREIRDIRTRHPTARISALAHSFGCYALLEALKEPDIVLHKVALCGSVAGDFRVAPYRAQIEFDPILNDCGTFDFLPALAQSATWGFGATGAFGFGTVGIRDRFHAIAHSGFFTADFVNRYWVPFFKLGTVVPSELDTHRETPPYWQSLLTTLPLRWVLSAALIWIAAASGLWAAEKVKGVSTVNCTGRDKTISDAANVSKEFAAYLREHKSELKYSWEGGISKTYALAKSDAAITDAVAVGPDLIIRYDWQQGKLVLRPVLPEGTVPVIGFKGEWTQNNGSGCVALMFWLTELQLDKKSDAIAMGFWGAGEIGDFNAGLAVSGPKADVWSAAILKSKK